MILNEDDENQKNTDILSSEINVDTINDYFNPDKKEKNTCFLILLHIFTFIPLLFILRYGFCYIYANDTLNITSTIRNYQSTSFILDEIIERCQLWVSADKNVLLPILRREECIWAKLWKVVSNFNESDICSVFSIIFPTIVKNGSEPLRSYFFSSFNYGQFDPKFFDEEKKLDWPDDSYKRMMPNNWKFNHHQQPLIGQKYIQKYIWEKQHPKSCSNVTFCILPPRRTGLGSSIHTFAMEMGFCLNRPNTVITYHPTEKDIWTNGPYCGKQNNLECFFEPLTSCKLPADRGEVKRRSFTRTRSNGFTMPHFVKNILNKLMIPSEYHEWYYTVAAVAYIMRLNKKTLNWLESYEKEKLINPKDVYDIGIHVRHGDKGTEMLLVKAKNYFPAVKIIQKVTGRKSENINVFLSTEDPSVINWFVNNSGCSVSYIDYPRNNPGRKGLLSGGAHLTLISLANMRISLRTAIRADTFGSNWDRLIVELLYSIAEKPDSLIFEMGIMRSLSAEHYQLMKKWKIARPWSYLPKKKAVYEPDDP